MPMRHGHMNWSTVRGRKTIYEENRNQQVETKTATSYALQAWISSLFATTNQLAFFTGAARTVVR